jgi:hypothetical protein
MGPAILIQPKPFPMAAFVGQVDPRAETALSLPIRNKGGRRVTPKQAAYFFDPAVTSLPN